MLKLNMIEQTPVFLQIYILPGQEEELRKVLESFGNPYQTNKLFPIEELGTVHFARWIIAPKTDQFKASLIYSANIDGDVDTHLKGLATFGEGINTLLKYCEGYDSTQDTETYRLNYLRKHSFKTPAFYVGAPARTVQQIKGEAEFHEEVRTFIHANEHTWSSEKEAISAIRSHFSANPKWQAAQKSYTLPKAKGLKMIGLLLLLAVLLPLIIVALILIFFFQELPSKSFGKTINDVDPDKLRRMKAKEDIIYQNQLSQVFETKGGLRKIFLHFILWATNFAAKNWFVKGQLMGTPTIHFARWVFIDGGKRYVFFSNFDCSYDGYLGDFVDNNGWGLNAIYGAAKGYPKTYFVFGRGSYRILEFLGWGRTTQVDTPMWYSAYPWMGLQQIVNRSLVRDALLSDRQLTEEEITHTLRNI